MVIKMYKRNDFGRELEIQINKNFDIDELSDWAHEKYLDNARSLDRETQSAIMKVISMTEGEQFEYTKEELLDFAKSLQK